VRKRKLEVKKQPLQMIHKNIGIPYAIDTSKLTGGCRESI
jgi:hypothetical protein